RGGEVDGVVATETLRVGQCGGMPDEALVDVNAIDLAVQHLELFDKPCVGSPVQAAKPTGVAQRCTRLGVEEPDGGHMPSLVPEPSCGGGTLLFDQEPYERRRVEVGDHRRCSATSSLTDFDTSTRLTGR